MIDPRGMRGLIARYNVAMSPYVDGQPSKHWWVFRPGAFAASLRAIDRGERVVSLLAGHDWKQHVTTTKRGLNIFSTVVDLRFEMVGLDRMSRKAIAAAHRLGLVKVSVGATATSWRAGKLRDGSQVMIVMKAELNEVSLVKDAADPSSYVHFSFPQTKSVPRSRSMPMNLSSRDITAAEFVLIDLLRGHTPSSSEYNRELIQKGLVYREGDRLRLTTAGEKWAKAKARLLPTSTTASTSPIGYQPRTHINSALGSSLCNLFG